MGLASLALALVVTAPLLGPGFVLLYDMVFVPSPHLSTAMLGISRTLPRAVPIDLLVALASRAATGMVVQKAALVAIAGGAALGASRLVPTERSVARTGAGVLYAWNPFVYERLLLGQWTLLLGYALLPWTVRAAVRLRSGERRQAFALALAMAAAAAASPYTGVFAVVLAAGILFAPPWAEGWRAAARWTALAVIVGATVNLPWLVPAVLHPAVPDRPALAAALFRARSDSPVGTVGSLASLGGLWRTDLAPSGRSGYGWVPAFVLIAALALAGWRAVTRRWPPGAVVGLLAVAGAGLVMAAAPAIPGLATATVWLAGHAPGGGFLRDSQKFVAPLALALSVGFGAGVDGALSGMAVASRPGTRMALATKSALPAILAVLPIALAPTLAWGAGGRLGTAEYPSSWSQAEAVMRADPAPGAVLVLPWHTYLPFGWNGDRPVHQPATRYFSRPVVADSALEVGGSALPAEDPWSRLAAPVVRRGDPLAPRLPGLGVRYVLLFKEADWRASAPLVAGLGRLLDQPDLALYRSSLPAVLPRFDTPPPAPVVAGDVVAILVVLVALAGRIWPARRPAGPPGNRLAILRSQGPTDEGDE